MRNSAMLTQERRQASRRTGRRHLRALAVLAALTVFFAVPVSAWAGAMLEDPFAPQPQVRRPAQTNRPSGQEQKKKPRQDNKAGQSGRKQPAGAQRGGTSGGGKSSGQATRGTSGGRKSSGQAVRTPPPVDLSKTHTNSIGMEFVLIPAGSFEMGCGSSESESNCDADEQPRHSVRISRPFYLGKYEVTQRQWEAVMGSNPSEFRDSNRPVEMVSWEDVQEFIKKLNAKEGHTRYRLPTEAEWEYAARAGSTAAYAFGNDKDLLGNYAWYNGNSGGETHAVGQNQSNARGLYDMHGNVWEWVQDWSGDYSGGTVVDPGGPEEGEDRMLRGGSWDGDAKLCRSAGRVWARPKARFNNLGFRLALSPGR